jgi:hypothetical protein
MKTPEGLSKHRQTVLKKLLLATSFHDVLNREALKNAFVMSRGKFHVLRKNPPPKNTL